MLPDKRYGVHGPPGADEFGSGRVRLRRWPPLPLRRVASTEEIVEAAIEAIVEAVTEVTEKVIGVRGLR